jgi:hypothetical protein
MGIGASIFLIAVGAILAFALNVDASTIGSVSLDWDVVGFILLAVGVVGLIWSAMLMSSWRDRRGSDLIERETVIDDTGRRVR